MRDSIINAVIGHDILSLVRVKSPALFSAYKEGLLSATDLGRSFEVTIGMALLRKPGQIYYWRQGDYAYQDQLIAIEVKSDEPRHTKGLHAFTQKYPHAKRIIITEENYLQQLALI